MKQYKHKRTGAIISVNSEIGGEWEPFEAPKAETPAEAKPKKKANKKKAEKPEEPTVTPEENAEGNQGEGEEA